MSLVELAHDVASIAHRGQTRKHGNRPYIYHPTKVAEYLYSKGYEDAILLAAAFLHDVVEDTETTYNTLEKAFGKEVAHLVWEVSHPLIATKMSRSKRWRIYLTHYEHASLLGQTLKLADRICNLQEYVDFWDDVPSKGRKFLQQVYLDESIDLLDTLIDVHKDIRADLLCIVNELDELCSEMI